MSFSGDLYPTAGAKAVMTTTGDLVRYNAGTRQRLGIGSTNQALSVVGGLPAWKTLTLADSVLTTAGDVLYENNTPELARLPKGSDADVLTLASGLPTWSAPSGGGGWSFEESFTLGADAQEFEETLSSAITLGSTNDALVQFEAKIIDGTGVCEFRANQINTGNFMSAFSKKYLTLAGEYTGNDDWCEMTRDYALGQDSYVFGSILIQGNTIGARTPMWYNLWNTNYNQWIGTIWNDNGALATLTDVGIRTDGSANFDGTTDNAKMYVFSRSKT